MLEEYDVVQLTSPLVEAAVPVGTKGTVVMLFEQSGTAYEVEFISQAGTSFGTFTVKPNQIVKWEPSSAANKQAS